MTPYECRLHHRRFGDSYCLLLLLQSEVTTQVRVTLYFVSLGPSWRQTPFGIHDQLLMCCQSSLSVLLLSCLLSGVFQHPEYKAI